MLLRMVGLEKSPKKSTVVITTAVVKEPYLEENVMLGTVREPAEPPEALKDLI